MDMDSQTVYQRATGTRWRGRRKWKKTKPYNSPKAEDLDIILGRWKVVKVYYEVYDDDQGSEISAVLTQADHMGDQVYEVPLPECKGVHVVFDDQCDVTWEVPSGVEPILLYQTTSYNIEKDSLDLIGGSDGRTFNFCVETNDENGDGDVICLKTPVTGEGEEPEDDTEEGNMMIVLERVKSAPNPEFEAFMMKGALDEGFFSDLVVRSSDGVTFNVHRTVLNCSSPKMGYREWEVYLATLKASLLKVTLNYIYCGTLPTETTVLLAKELLETVSTHPKLTRLAELCQTFIASHDLKQRLIQLVDDIQGILELAKKIIANTEMSNPVKVTYTIKLLAKEAAVVATKFGLLCELYTRNKKEMNKKEKHEVLEYMRGRVVVFVDLLNELIELALEKYNSLTDDQKAETASYIIPEVGLIWNLVNATCGDIQRALLTRDSSLHKKKSGLRRQDIKLSLILQFAARGRELKRMQRIGKEFEEFVVVSKKKREEFDGWSEGEKVERIIRAMVALKQEGEHQMKQLQEVKMEILMENALDWKKFKILVAVCCSYVSWGLRKLQALREPLKPALLKACKFVHRSEVNDALVYFNILDEDDLRVLLDDDDDDDIGAVGGRIRAVKLKDKMPGLESLNVSESLLAKGCLKLLDTCEHSDMQFILEGSVLSETTPTGDVATPTGDVATPISETVVIHAHRVIVASRSEWFKRALQSGMKEAIDRCIVIHGTDESVFRTFLHYLYGGHLDTGAMSLDDIIELLAVADHYETTSLRVMCEGVLVERVEDSNAFPLLQVADRYSARKLREATLEHILNNPDIVMTEVDGYSSLPDELKQELRSLLSATTDPRLLLRHLQGPPPASEETTTMTDSHSSSSSSGSSSTQSHEHGDESFKLDEKFHHPNTLAFQAAIDKLRGIVGAEGSDELLKDLLLAADMDVNRALNFYFNTQTD